jgi:hypothetical protein
MKPGPGRNPETRLVVLALSPSGRDLLPRETSFVGTPIVVHVEQVAPRSVVPRRHATLHRHDDFEGTRLLVLGLHLKRHDTVHLAPDDDAVAATVQSQALALDIAETVPRCGKDVRLLPMSPGHLPHTRSLRHKTPPNQNCRSGACLMVSIQSDMCAEVPTNFRHGHKYIPLA